MPRHSLHSIDFLPKQGQPPTRTAHSRRAYNISLLYRNHPTRLRWNVKHTNCMFHKFLHLGSRDRWFHSTKDLPLRQRFTHRLNWHCSLPLLIHLRTIKSNHSDSLVSNRYLVQATLHCTSRNEPTQLSPQWRKSPVLFLIMTYLI